MTCPWTPIVDASPRSWILSPPRLRHALEISALATKTWSCSPRAPPDIPSGRIGAPRRFDLCCEPGWPRLLSPPAHRPSSVVPLPAPWEVVYRCIPEPVFTGAAHTLQQRGGFPRTLPVFTVFPVIVHCAWFEKFPPHHLHLLFYFRFTFYFPFSFRFDYFPVAIVLC